MDAIFLLLLILFADVCLEFRVESLSKMSAANNTTIVDGGTLLVPSSYSVYKYIRHRSPRLDSPCPAIPLSGSTFTIVVCRLESDTTLSS